MNKFYIYDLDRQRTFQNRKGGIYQWAEISQADSGGKINRDRNGEYKKRFLTLFILFFSLCVSLLPISAQDVDEENYDDCPMCSMTDAPYQIDYGAIEYYQALAENTPLYNSREAAENPFAENPFNGSRSILRASVTSQGRPNSEIIRYYQAEYDDLLCPNTDPYTTIADAGCVVTSFAMIATKYGINVTPLDVRTRLNLDAPGTDSACNFPWFNVVTVSPFTSLTAQEIISYNWSVAYNNIEGAILANRPVLAYMNGPAGAHAVVVYVLSIIVTVENFTIFLIQILEIRITKCH